MITVLGATGNIGSRIAHNLVAKGEKVRVVVRNSDKLASDIRTHAEVRTGDATNLGFLTDAFRGSDAVFALIPPNFAVADFRKYQNEFGEVITKALSESGVNKIVFLSSIAADQPRGTGPIVGVHLQEERMKRALPKADILFLRPAYFMENLFANIALIKGQGINGSIIKPEVKMHLVATQDIGDIATEALIKRDFKGVSALGISGPEKLTMSEVTHALGNAIAKPDLAYVAFPVEAAISAMQGAGLTLDMASQYAEMSTALNTGLMNELGDKVAKGKTSIQTFAKTTFAAIYNS